MKSRKLRKQLTSLHQTSIYPLFVTYFNTFFPFFDTSDKYRPLIHIFNTISFVLETLGHIKNRNSTHRHKN